MLNTLTVKTNLVALICNFSRSLIKLNLVKTLCYENKSSLVIERMKTQTKHMILLVVTYTINFTHFLLSYNADVAKSLSRM